MTPTNNIGNTRLFGSICLDDIPKELIVTGRNGKRYLQVIIDKRREPGKCGNTHYIKFYVRAKDRKPGENSHIGDLRPSTAPTRSGLRAEQHREYVERKRLEAMEEQPQEDKRNTYGQ
jgi:hypothetical protein